MARKIRWYRFRFHQAGLKSEWSYREFLPAQTVAGARYALINAHPFPMYKEDRLEVQAVDHPPLDVLDELFDDAVLAADTYLEKSRQYAEEKRRVTKHHGNRTRTKTGKCICGEG